MPAEAQAIFFRRRHQREQAAISKPATIARIMAGGPPSYCPVSREKTDGGENDRLGAGACRGSRRRLRHSISAVGPETPSTKKRPLGPERRLPSSASSSDSAISEGWPVSSACLTITRWRAIWTANSAICRLAGARCAKRNHALAGSPALPRPERRAQCPSTVAHSADILLPCSSRISPPSVLASAGDFPPRSRQGQKNTASQDQTGQSGTCDGGGDG